MNTIRIAFAATALLLAAAASSAQGQEASGVALPEACTTGSGAGSAMSPIGGMAAPADAMDEAHQALMASMEPMNASMMVGMTAPDLDVAFACGMIGHHQGAIDMAKVELQYGDDPWAREMAQMVIDAQTKEIADIIKWLEDQPK